MVGAALKKYAKARGLKLDGGLAYGELQGYSVCMEDGPNLKQVSILTRFPDSEHKYNFENRLSSVDLKSEYRVQSTEFRDDRLIFVFTDKIGTMGLIEKFMDWLLPQLPLYGASGADVCTHCGCAMNGQGGWYLIDGAAEHLHEGCFNSLSEQLKNRDAEIKENAGGNYVSGLIGALIGGLIGAAIWGFILKQGYVASIFGLVIGFLAEKGYTLLKGKPGKGKVIILIAVVLISVAAGTFFGEYLSIIRELKEYEGFGYTANELFRVMWQSDAEFRSAVFDDCLSNGLIGLLFAALGTFGILRRTHTEVSGTSMKKLK